MKKTILTLVGIGLLVVWSVMAQTNPCIWNPWTLATAPTISVTVNSPGNQCIGTQVSVTATAATTDGTKTRTDNCGNSQTNALTLSIPTWTWSLSGVTANVTSGTTNTAIFTPSSAGTATVTFIATATTTDPNGTYSATNSVSFKVFEVASITPNIGNQAAPGSSVYNVCIGNGTVTIHATSNPPATVSELPACWSLTADSPSVTIVDKLTATMTTDAPTAGPTITATSGNSSKAVKVQVVCPDETITMISSTCCSGTNAYYGGTAVYRYACAANALWWSESVSLTSDSCNAGSKFKTSEPFLMNGAMINAVADDILNVCPIPASSCQTVTSQTAKVGVSCNSLTCQTLNTQTITVTVTSANPPHGTVTTKVTKPGGGGDQITCSF